MRHAGCGELSPGGEGGSSKAGGWPGHTPQARVSPPLRPRGGEGRGAPGRAGKACGALTGSVTHTPRLWGGLPRAQRVTVGPESAGAGFRTAGAHAHSSLRRPREQARPCTPSDSTRSSWRRPAPQPRGDLGCARVPSVPDRLSSPPNAALPTRSPGSRRPLWPAEAPPHQSATLAALLLATLPLPV